jgi:hypothetical protein
VSFLSANQVPLSFLDAATRQAVIQPIQGNENAIALTELVSLLERLRQIRGLTTREHQTIVRPALQAFYFTHYTDEDSIEPAIQAFVQWMESPRPWMIPFINVAHSLRSTSGSFGIGDATLGVGSLESATTPTIQRDQNIHRASEPSDDCKFPCIIQ